jgi:hypothetical protein
MTDGEPLSGAPQSRPGTTDGVETAETSELVAEATRALEQIQSVGPSGITSAESKLSADLKALIATLPADEKPKLRTLHHFACTGGTLLSRCVAAQPNSVLLSEIDPFSPHLSEESGFAPADLIRHAQAGLRPLSTDGLKTSFLASLEGMHEATRRSGRYLVIRDHTHSHFCRDALPVDRPPILTLLAERFCPVPLVTVRHPLDSFISLHKLGWISFSPRTLEEYSKRYHAFLDAYSDAPIVRYEDFVVAPEAQAEIICRHLELPISAHWKDYLSVIQLSGDSGRSSTEIKPRARQSIPDDVLDQIEKSPRYNLLCGRLSYPSDPDVDLFAT